MNNLIHNLPALIVALPLAAAPLVALVSSKNENSRWLAWLACFAVSGLCGAAASYLLVQIEIFGTVAYDFGGWSSAIGIQYVLTEFNIVLILLVSMLAFFTLPFALPSIEAEIDKSKIPFFYACFMLCLSGLLGMLSTNDLFNFFVFLEISSLCSYALVASRGTVAATKAAYNYLIIGSIGGSFYLLGVMLVYAQTGTLNFNDAAQILASAPNNNVIAAAFCLLALGLMIKAGVFPLASWLPNAYAQAPSFVSGFLAGTATKVALFALIKVLFVLFSANLSFGFLAFDKVLLWFALAAIFYGSISALFQINLKKMLAFSSIANVGYIVLGVALLTQSGLVAAIFALIGHAIGKSGAMLAAGAMANRLGLDELTYDKIRGIGRKMPFTCFLFILFGLSLIGIPLTAGFIGKFYLLSASIEQNTSLMPLLVGAIALSSLLAVAYVWRVVEAAYFGKFAGKKLSDPSSYYLLPLWTLAAIGLYLGLFPSALVRLVENVAGGLLL